MGFRPYDMMLVAHNAYSFFNCVYFTAISNLMALLIGWSIS